MSLEALLPPMPLRVAGADEYEAWIQSRAEALWRVVLSEAEAKAAEAGYALAAEDQEWLASYLPTTRVFASAGLGEVAEQFELVRVHREELARWREGPTS